MLGAVSSFDTNSHTLIGGDLGDYIARLSGNSRRDFAVLRYEKLDVFCIVEFLSPRRDVFVDTMNLGSSLANFTREKRYELERRVFKPLTCSETSRAIMEGESDYHHMLQDGNEEETERLERVAIGE